MNWKRPRGRRRSAPERPADAPSAPTTRLRIDRSEVKEPDFSRAFPGASVSFVYRVSATCSTCGATFVEEMPLILDEVERPALWEKAINGAVGRFRCPAGHEAPDANVSMLLRDRRARLFFVPGDAVVEERWRATAAALVGGLPASLLTSPQIELCAVRRDHLAEVLTAPPPTPLSPRRELPVLLAEIERARDDGERIRLLECAVAQVSRTTDPDAWANLAFRLGYTRVTAGDTSARTRKTLREASAVYTAIGHPAESALVLHILGSAAWVASSESDDALDEAIEANRGAVARLDPEGQRSAWAKSQRTLGAALLARGFEDDVEAAVPALTAALEHFPGESEDVRGEIELDLAEAALRRGDDLSALEHFDAAARLLGPDEPRSWLETQLEGLDAKARPGAWGGLTERLATGLLVTRLGHRGANLDRAIVLLEAVVRMAPDVGTDTVLEAHRGLGYAYGHRLGEDKGENLRRSLEHHQAALALSDRDSVEWIYTQHELGNTWRRLPTGDRGENVGRAIDALEAAHSRAQSMVPPRERFRIANDLATTYAARASPADLDRAIEILSDLPAAVDRGAAPQEWAGFRGNLGNLRLLRGADGDLAAAVTDFEAALSVYGRDLPLPDDAPRDMTAGYLARDWATLQAGLGTACASNRDGDLEDNADRAVCAYRAALRVLTPERHPAAARGIAANLANVLIEQRRWPEAHAALLAAIRAADLEYAQAVTDTTKEATLADVGEIHRKIVDVCLRLDPPHRAEALVRAEEGRSRLLRDQLAALKLPAPPGYEQDARVSRERNLLGRLRALQRRLDAENITVEVRRALVDHQSAARKELLAIWEELSADPHAAEYVALRQGEQLDWGELVDWLQLQGPRVALLEYFALPERLVAFLVRAGDEEPAVIPVDIAPADLDEVRRRCEREVHRYDAGWDLEESWQDLAAPLVAPLVPELADVDLLYVVPHGALHGIPVHAIAIGETTLLDAAAVVYAPSAMVARRVSFGQGGKDATAPPLVVGNATGDLDSAEAEALEVAQRFGVTPLIGADARVEAVSEALEHAEAAHFACHAYFDANDPFSSGIELADGVMTARAILGGRVQTNRLILSACETGMVEVREGDELFGLSRAFIYAGVPAIVATLWAVDDPATKDLMLATYDRLGDPQGLERPATLAQALREAMLEARCAGAHTHLWAPFVLIGSPS